MTAQVRRVVRALGSGKTHVADVPVELFARYVHIGSEFTGVALPLAMCCMTTLRGQRSAAVCMEAGTPVGCRTCKGLTGIAVAPDDNTEMPGRAVVPGDAGTVRNGGTHGE